jgi:alanine racemase
MFAPVLKSNAYGHGLVLIASLLKKEHLPFFVVDSLIEARLLRDNRIKTPIVIIGYNDVYNCVYSKIKNVSYVITSLEQLQKLSESITSIKIIHLKIDTGMHRQGILPEEIPKAIRIIQQDKNIALEGICSHFSSADDENASITQKQIDVWNSLVKIFQNEFSSIRYFHIGATAGSVYSKKCHANVIRLGIGLYGFDTSLQNNLSLGRFLR